VSTTVDTARLDEIIAQYPGGEPSLIMVLQDIQNEYNYLPKEALQRAAERLDVPLAKVYGVATFYRSFSLKPRGKHICKVCLGTACHIRGGQPLVDELERLLEVKAGGTTKDGEMTLETVNCVGACAMAPVVIVDKKYHAGVKPIDCKNLIRGGGDQ